MSYGRFSLPTWSSIALALAASACAPESSEHARPNVLVIAVDTLRADRLGCYGGTRGLTPNIDRLATRGVVFEHAFSHAPWTLPSFASLFSSLYPQQHGAGGNIRTGFRPLVPDVETLTERLQQAGYATHAIVNVDFLAPELGVVQGFDTVDARFSDDNRTQRDARETTAQALRWLDAAPRKPFFLFVHYFDPHAVYEPPQPFRSRLAEPQDASSASPGFGTRDQVVAHRAGKLPLGEDVLRRARGLYDGEVAFTDAQVGVLLDGLSERGLDERTLIVFTSDHGEEFGEHGSWEHGHSHYDELLHVPLIIARPGRVSPARFAHTAAHVDVAPTICAQVGLAPGAAFRGTDLLAERRNAAAPLHVAHGNFWGGATSSLRTGDLQLIARTEADGRQQIELYRWRADPRERVDLAAKSAESAVELARMLADLERELGASGFRTPSRLALPSALEQRLNSLGYVLSDDGEDE